MDTGETVKAVVNGATVELVLDERVLADPTCYQWDTGWWAYNVEDEASQYFVSTEGVVYGETPTNNGELRAFQTSLGGVICAVCGISESRGRCHEFQMTSECRKMFA